MNALRVGHELVRKFGYCCLSPVLKYEKVQWPALEKTLNKLLGLNHCNFSDY